MDCTGTATPWGKPRVVSQYWIKIHRPGQVWGTQIMLISTGHCSGLHTPISGFKNPGASFHSTSSYLLEYNSGNLGTLKANSQYLVVWYVSRACYQATLKCSQACYMLPIEQLQYVAGYPTSLAILICSQVGCQLRHSIVYPGILPTDIL